MEKFLLFQFLFVLIFSNNVSQGQTKSELERQRRETQEIINTTSRLLEQTSTTRQSSLERLSIINRRLQLRNDLISTMESEIRYLDNGIVERETKIQELETELRESKESYANLIRIAYRHRMAHQRFMFVLAANDFNQAYRRLKYLQQYGRSRQKQIQLIESLTKDIEHEIEELESQKDQKVGLLQLSRNEKNALSVERQEQNSLVEQLRKQENQLKQELATRQKEALALQNAIESLLKDEAEIASPGTYELTPADKIISDEFQNNKGGLPWPTNRGVITGFFGEHPHPVLRGIKIQNNGVDITTEENAEVKSVFNGIVRQVLTVPGSNNVVLIRHGNFLTVYANLSHVYVRAGDNVVTGQLIGRVFTDNDDSKAILHLEIWEENIKLDPMLWLSRQ